MNIRKFALFGIGAVVILLLAAVALYAVLMLTSPRPAPPPSNAAAAASMQELWSHPPEHPNTIELKRLLLMCAYVSPATRDAVQTESQSYRFLDLWQDVIDAGAADQAITAAQECTADPESANPTPPQIMHRQEIRNRDPAHPPP